MRKASGLIFLFFIFQASLLSGESADQLLLAGQKAFSQKFFSSAAKNFAKLTEDYPEDSRADDAEYLLCVSFFYLGDYQKCLTTLLGFKRKYQNSKYLKYTDYWQGNALYYLGRREEALELFKSQIAGYPDELYFLKYSLLLEGIIYEELKQGEEAIEVYRELLQLLSDSAAADNLMPEVLYRLGGVELELNHFFKSRSIFSRLLFDYPESSFSSNALFFLAESYYFLEDFQAAFDRYERAAVFSGHPYGDTIMFRMSRILGRRGRLQDALGYLEKLESSFPASSHLQEAEQLRGEIYFDLRDYDRAVIAYRKAILLVRDKDELQALHYNLAMAAYLAGLKEEAAEYFAISAAGNEKKTKESALFNLGVALADLKRNNEAIESLKSFTKTFPASVHLQEALTLLGNLYSIGGSAAAAAEAFTRLISYYPDSPEKYEYYFKRGNSRRAQNNNIKALKDFQVVIKDLPHTEMGRESLYNVGYIYSQKNEYRRALSYFTRILDEESGAELTHRTLLATGFCRYNLGEYEESLADFTRLAAAGNAAWSGKGFFHQGRVLYKLERLPEAAKSFSRAAQELNSSSGRAEAIFWQGLTEFRLNNLEQARDIFLSIPVLYPDNQRIAESFYRAGLCEAALRNYAGSVEYFDRSLKLSGRKTSVSTDTLKGSAATLLQEEALYEKGFSLFMIGKRREAEAVLQRLAADFPGSPLVPEGYYRLAQHDYEQQRYKESLEGFILLYSVYTESQAGGSALYWAGASSVALADYREALALFWRYLKRVPGGSYTNAALQEIKEILGTIDPHTAIAFLDKAEKEEDVPAWLKNSLRYEYAAAIFDQRREEAFALLQKIRQEGPEEPVKSRSNFLIGRYYQESGELRRALDIFTALAELRADRTGAAAQMNIARILKRMDKREEAALEYLKVSYIFPDYPDLVEEAIFEAILLFRSLGAQDKAQQLYIKLKNEFPLSRRIIELE